MMINLQYQTKMKHIHNNRLWIGNWKHNEAQPTVFSNKGVGPHYFYFPGQVCRGVGVSEGCPKLRVAAFESRCLHMVAEGYP
jgi:hypothetical protein